MKKRISEVATMGKGMRGQRLSRGRRTAAWCTGGGTVLLALLVRLWAGSPRPLLCLWGAADRLPPFWILSLLWVAGWGLWGGLGGAVMSDRSGGAIRAAWRLRGGIYFLLSLFLGLLWYPLLFRVQLPVLSWLILCGAALLAAVCVLCWGRVDRRALLAGGVYVGWQGGMLVMQVALLLR